MLVIVASAAKLHIAIVKMEHRQTLETDLSIDTGQQPFDPFVIDERDPRPLQVRGI